LIVRQWGDFSSPLLLPSMQMASRATVAATGGLASIISPSSETETDTETPPPGDSINVALGLDTGFEFESKV
jgi:hypothetical protein